MKNEKMKTKQTRNRRLITSALAGAFALAALITFTWNGQRTSAQTQVTQLKIAFQTFRDGNREIYLMNPDGSNQTRVTKLAGDSREEDEL